MASIGVLCLAGILIGVIFDLSAHDGNDGNGYEEQDKTINTRTRKKQARNNRQPSLTGRNKDVTMAAPWTEVVSEKQFMSHRCGSALQFVHFSGAHVSFSLGSGF